MIIAPNTGATVLLRNLAILLPLLDCIRWCIWSLGALLTASSILLVPPHNRHLRGCIGRYERGDISPSIEVVSKIADALEVSIDYLIGKTKMELDKQALIRLKDISQLPEENRKFILNLLDMALRDFKVKKAHNQ